VDPRANTDAAGDDRLARFTASFPFSLDDYQLSACAALAEGSGVLVAAPTGSGKTVVGEFAVTLALGEGRKCFYTTPIKALSNQKYDDLVSRFGPENVGLLTGDVSVNGEAPVVVMTTEVLRNMLYAGSRTLEGLGYVVMDEVHYLADPFRGAAWEEVIIHLSESVALVSLSATVSNAEEFGDWLREVRGDTAVIVSERRPVPLYQHVMSGRSLHDLFADDGPTAVTGEGDAREHKVNPELMRIAREDVRFHGRVGTLGPRGSSRGRPRQLRGHRAPRDAVRGDVVRARTPRRHEVARALERARLLPAIYFIFSRVGCDAAVEQCLQGDIRLTRPHEIAEIDAELQRAASGLSRDDLYTLRFEQFAEGLRRGIACHHAGLLPVFKECVEHLFVKGLVKVVFATETLALGINMPARTVVLEKLSKYNGETHADLTPGEYTQLTGRAGRRGIDIEGHAVVLWQPGLDPRALSGLASTRTYPLRSSFRPSYNMAVNLVAAMGPERAKELLESSFAQFQADRSVVGIARSIRRNEDVLDGYAEGMACDRGDFTEYAKLRQRLSEREREHSRARRAERRGAIGDALRRLRPGEVIDIHRGRDAGPVVVIDGDFPGGDPRISVLTLDRRVARVTVQDFAEPVETLARVKMPKGFNSRVPAHRRDLAAKLHRRLTELGLLDDNGSVAPNPDPDAEGVDSNSADSAATSAPDAETSKRDNDQIRQLKQQLRQHPCHDCPDREDHARWAERYLGLDRQTQAMRASVEQRTNTLGRDFDRVCRVLQALGYLDGDQVTDAGRMLCTLYTELDLLLAESIRTGVFDELDERELAAAVAGFVYQARTDNAPDPVLPTARTHAAFVAIEALWRDLKHAEAQQRLTFLRPVDTGFVDATYQWASGADLAEVLMSADIAPGDFVRWTKQVIDVLGQVADGAGPQVRAKARAGLDLVRRGLVLQAD